MEIEELEEIKWNKFVRINDVPVKRETLPESHPESIYNYIKRDFNVNPEDYGIYRNFQEKWKVYSKEELINTIEHLFAKIDILQKEKAELIQIIDELNIIDNGIQETNIQ